MIDFDQSALDDANQIAEEALLTEGQRDLYVFGDTDFPMPG